MKRALVIEHDESGPAAGVGERLVERGHQLDVFRVLDDQGEPVTDTDSIGSWIGREIEMVRTAHDAGVAVLGLCFGGQVLSTALGGEVRRVDTPELGWHEVDTDLPDAIAPGPWFEWHYDGFTVPDGATEIARTAVSPQAFRIGRSVGTQFHPEITAEIVNLWISMDGRALRAHGVDPAVMAARTADEVVANRARSDVLVDWFLDGD